jgi:hypothetical protein
MAPPNKLLIDGKEIPCKPGYVQLGDTLGAYRNTRLGFQLETTRAFEGRIEWNGSVLTHLGPRSRRTLRFGEAIPTPYYIPGHESSDWFDGGLQGMDLCGTAGRAHDWDRMHARTPVFGLIDIATGKPRRPASIAMPAIGVYSLERAGPTSILPEYGETDEKANNGQHDKRRGRWGDLIARDEFVERDMLAVTRDLGLAWNGKRAAAILQGPKACGSYDAGREFAFVLIAAVAAGDTPLVDRLCKIALHVQTAWGNLQISADGNPAPPDNVNWYSDAEAHYQVVALKKAGLDRQARKLADVSVKIGRKGKYLRIGTGEGSPLSDGGPTDGTAWGAAACGVYNRSELIQVSTKWKIGPDWNGALHGPYADLAACRARHIYVNQPGKSRWFLEATA